MKPKRIDAPPKVRDPERIDKPKNPEKIDRGSEDRRRRDYDDREYKPGDTLPDGTEVIAVSSAKEANEQLAKQGYTRPPYDPDSPVYMVKTTGEQHFVRVYGGKSGQQGQWIMRYEDIKGLTPKQIKEKFALEHEPEMICDVEVPSGTKLRTGITGEQKQWKVKGGGQQYDFMGKHLPNIAWKNGREIGDYVK